VTGAVESPAGRRSLVPALVEDFVPERLPGAVVREPLVDARPDAFLIRMPAGRFLVEPGHAIRVERAPGATDADVRCFLEGPVAAAAALLNGLIPLRAATVVIGGRAVAIAGVSAAGKSALAAALALRGHAVLADAVTPIATDVARAATPIVQSHAPDVVLWPDMVAELGLDPAAGRRVRPALPKLAFRLGVPAAPAQLDTVIFLRRDMRRASPTAEPVVGAAKVKPLLNAAWHRALVGPLGLSPRRFTALARIVSAGRCIELARPPGGASPVELAALVEEVVE
jgi:hypothetical protein